MQLWRSGGTTTLPMTDDIQARLEKRMGRVHARQRIGIENDHEKRVFGQGLNFFHIENWYSVHSLIRNTLRMTGLYGRGVRNAARVRVQRNTLRIGNLPPEFAGYTILHLSDMHVDMNPGAMARLIELLPDLSWDICVITGDFRGKTFGPFDEMFRAMEPVRERLGDSVYGVLGNHDTIRMVPGLEDMGIRMLLNESVEITRGGGRLHLAGIDDAHYFRVDNIEKAAQAIPHEEASILLSHTPEIYRQAAHADFDVLLGGHTHGGQICLPGSIPVTLDSVLPRYMGSGAWTYHNMSGYTSVGVGSSVVVVRLNCLPEITLHELQPSSA
jgi:predicted MPP superfamily phosphohydrolase